MVEKKRQMVLLLRDSILEMHKVKMNPLDNPGVSHFVFGFLDCLAFVLQAKTNELPLRHIVLFLFRLAMDYNCLTLTLF